jgi:hypothetical protein
VTVIGVVAVRMMEADINPEIDLVILRVPPTRVDDLICICRGIDGTVRDAIIHAIMTVVIDPITKAVRPVSTLACIADPGLWWRCASRRRRRTIFARLVARVRKNDIVVGIVGRGMIEDGFLRGVARIRRIQKRRDRCLQRGQRFRRRAAHAEEKAAKQESCQCMFE